MEELNEVGQADIIDNLEIQEIVSYLENVLDKCSNTTDIILNDTIVSASN